MVGHVAVENLFWFVLFDRALDVIPPQARGFYLFEGQSWEVAFVTAWKRRGLGELIAVPHSTIRFWDLRCFPDMRDSSGRGMYSCPIPDLVAVNGPLARSTLLGAEFPPERIVECEALRYQHLGVVERWRPRQRDPDQPMRVLMVTDYLKVITETMIRMAEEALPDLPAGTQIAIKAHPHSVFDAAALERLKLKVHQEQISQVFQDYDMAFVSSGSSAVVDLYVLGLPIIIFQFEDNLDFNPLKGFADLPTVGTSRELVQALMNTEVSVELTHEADDIFFLDPSLNRWNSLLNSPPHG
jgi:surface carbohydrate biosynthesis protein (TIGR04326 family)